MDSTVVQELENKLAQERDERKNLQQRVSFMERRLKEAKKHSS
jgi:hypothetical protein